MQKVLAMAAGKVLVNFIHLFHVNFDAIVIIEVPFPLYCKMSNAYYLIDSILLIALALLRNT